MENKNQRNEERNNYWENMLSLEQYIDALQPTSTPHLILCTLYERYFIIIKNNFFIWKGIKLRIFLTQCRLLLSSTFDIPSNLKLITTTVSFCKTWWRQSEIFWWKAITVMPVSLARWSYCASQTEIHRGSEITHSCERSIRKQGASTENLCVPTGRTAA